MAMNKTQGALAELTAALGDYGVHSGVTVLASPDPS